MSPEYLSSVALVASVAVYALAMFAHAAEWAAARGARRSPRARASGKQQGGSGFASAED